MSSFWKTISVLLFVLGSFPGIVAARYSNFREKCATPWLDDDRVTLRAPCKEACSWCHSFYVSAIDLNKCVGVDQMGNLIPRMNGDFSVACEGCFTSWMEPDILRCNCLTSRGRVHEGATLNLNTVIGNKCGRLACWDTVNDLGPPLLKPDPIGCDVKTDDPNGWMEAQTASPPASTLALG